MAGQRTNAAHAVEHRAELIAMRKRKGVTTTSRNTGVPKQTMHAWEKREKAC
jgi:DNA-binding transcriptional regulator YiaG